MNKRTSYHFVRPRFFPALITLIAVAVMACLGVWQLQRLAWKEALIATVEQARALPPVTALPEDDAAISALAYRKATLTGTFLQNREFHVIGRYHKGTLGYHIVAPLKLKDGRLLLVNRGWVPTELKEPQTREESIPHGRQTISGLLRPPESKRRFLPDTDPAKNLWLSIDKEGMERFSGLSFAPLILETVGEEKPGVWPLPLTGEVSLRNDHLGYAITWFSIAAAALGVFLLYHRRKVEA